MEHAKMHQELNVIKFLFIFLISFKINAQDFVNVPKLVSGKFINDELKARCAPRDGRCFVIGIYKFKVEQNGSVDSVVSLGNTGSYIDSLQIKEFRALRFKAFNNQQDMLQWFQIKIFGSYTTHETSKYLRGLSDTIHMLYKQEIKDYFPKEKSYLIKENIIHLPPTWSVGMQ
jgi:hypothetical protein